MAEKHTCVCGASVDPGANFCGSCGKALSGKTVCPHCSKEVDPSNFCPWCGEGIRVSQTGPDMRENVWARGEEDFAAAVSTQMIDAAAGGSFSVRHGSKALFFEEGRLVEIAESGRYTTQEDGLINRLLKKKRKLSAVVVDAGDVELGFAFAGLKTKDGLFADVGMDVVVRLEDPNSFFVNMMKERKAFKIVELRRILFGEIQNALQEAVRNYDFTGLNTGIAAKNELASRMEAHLRQTFSRSGLGFGQIRNLRILHKDLDEAERISAEAKAQTQRTTAEAAQKDAQMFGKKTLGEKDIEEGLLNADLIRKRLDVFNRLKTAEIDKIKSEEDFRKFKAEIDKDRVLDESEWEEFKDEILWKKDDRKRDRQFLVQKIELQQAFEAKRLKIINDGELDLEQKRQKLKESDLDFEHRIKQEVRQAEARIEVEKAKAMAMAAADEVIRIKNKETEIAEALKDIQLEKEKAAARHENTKLDLEERRLNQELGLTGLERVKAIKRKDEHDRNLNAVEIRRQQLDTEIKKEESQHRMRMETLRNQSELQNQRIAAMSNLDLEHLIAASDGTQAQILGELSQSKTLKGLSAEEILAMKNPEALGKALEERARNTQNTELRGAFEQIAGAYKDAADRAERMNADALRAMSDQAYRSTESERSSADRAERVAKSAMEQMGNVASSNRGSGQSSKDNGQEKRVQICRKCKLDVKVGVNFCPNCGEQLY